MKSGAFSVRSPLRFRALLLVAACGMQAGIAFASTSTSANYGIVAASIDTGGRRASSANYSSNGSLGAISGLTTVASPAETNKSGSIGQLYQVTGLVLNTGFINNGTMQQLSAQQTLDDGTALILIGDSQSWNVIAGQLPTGLTLNSSMGVISGTPTGTGGYSFTILVGDGLGNSAQQAFDAMSFSQWEAQFSQLSDLSPTATPQEDGEDNLLKYLFNVNPSQPMTPSDRAALPAVGIDATSVPGAQYLALTYRQYQLLAGVAVTVQTSMDLKTWTTVDPPDLSQQVGTDTTTGDPIIEVGVLIPPNTRKQFIRLTVTQL